jgi:2-polyprenyl-6-methoxyphenol hydroxylase-like FAD-dependent oxidoreductase
VTLLGDAAHPSTPNLGQGACQAFEDAAVLAECLSASDHDAGALRAYEARRMRRAGMIVAQAGWMSRLGQWESRPACWLRERLIRCLPAWANRQHLRWLFHFEP